MTDAAPIDCTALIRDMAERARHAARALAAAPAATKTAALRAAAAALRAGSDEVLAANAGDMARGAAGGLSPAMLDRLRLDPDRLAGIAAALEAVADLPDPVGAVIDRSTRPNGLALARVRVPLGVIAIIYESRPNVTVDAGALALMAGNAVILRGGSEAQASNRALHACLVAGLRQVGLPEDAAQLVPVVDRNAVGALLAAAGLVDLVVPRGGKGLVARVQAEARVPVLAHLDGINHVYVDAAADPDKAVSIVVNSKMRRPGICGAAETLLVDRRAPGLLPILIAALRQAGCRLLGDDEVRSADPSIAPVERWDVEHLDAIMAIGIVDGVEGAIAHIAAHGSDHTDAIVTEDAATADLFLASVDSAIVLHNASTQFADGQEFGFGAEIGIATGRLHARGPVALRELTTYKTLVHGDGQVRA